MRWLPQAEPYRVIACRVIGTTPAKESSPVARVFEADIIAQTNSQRRASQRRGSATDIESTIQFWLEQQARHEARQQEFEANISQINAALLQVNEMVLQTNANLIHVTAAQERTSEILATLAERQIKTEEALSDLAGQVQTLMAVVERNLTNHDHQ